MNKTIKIGDVFLIAGLLILSIGGIIFLKINSKPGATVEISVGGDLVKVFELKDNTEYRVHTEAGDNLVCIEAGKVTVTWADCPDKVCVNHEPIDETGETIICLPHKLVVEIVE